MAEFAIEVTGIDANTWAIGYRDSERGHLKSVVMVAPSLWLSEGYCFGICGVMSGGRGEEYIKAVFYSGHVSGAQKGEWTGDFPLEPSDTIFFQIRTEAGVVIRCAGRIEIGGG